MLSVGMKYSTCDLIRDLNYCAWVQKLRYVPENVMMSALLVRLCICNLWIPLLNPSFEIMLHFFIYIFYLFSGFQLRFYHIAYTYFTHNAASNAVIDDPTN